MTSILVWNIETPSIEIALKNQEGEHCGKVPPLTYWALPPMTVWLRFCCWIKETETMSKSVKLSKSCSSICRTEPIPGRSRKYPNEIANMHHKHCRIRVGENFPPSPISKGERNWRAQPMRQPFCWTKMPGYSKRGCEERHGLSLIEEPLGTGPGDSLTARFVFDCEGLNYVLCISIVERKSMSSTLNLIYENKGFFSHYTV